MKKIFVMLLVTSLFFIVTAMVILPSNKVGQKSPKATIAKVIPDDLNIVFKKDCMACHGDEGSKMAMSKVNFSKWDTYSPEKQAKKAQAICKIITKGKMPPKGYKKNNPDSIPTQAEITSICNWANSLNVKTK